MSGCVPASVLELGRRDSGRSGEEFVGETGLGALDEGPDLIRFQDEGRAGRVGGLAQGDPATGEFLGFQANAAVGTAPGLTPAVWAQLDGGHAVSDVHGQISLPISRSTFAVLSAGAAWAQIRSMTSRYAAASWGLSR